MKRGKILPIILLAALVLSACGGGSDSSTSMSSPSFSTGQAAGEYWSDNVQAESAGDSSALSAGLQTEEKIIYSADMELETKDFDAACAALDQAVEALGGRYESRRLNQGGTYRYLSGTVRVPAGRFRDFLNLAGQAAHVTYCNEYTENVGEAYYDREARLATQRTKLERLQALLAQAAGMEDIIRLEEAISDTELQIEYLAGELRRYDSLIDYSTVTVSVQEVYRLSTDEEAAQTFGQRLGAAFAAGFRHGVEGCEDFLVALASNWVAILLLAAIAGSSWAIYRRKKRRKLPPQREEE